MMRCCGWRAWSATCRTWPLPTRPPCTSTGGPATWPRSPAAAAGSQAHRVEAASLTLDRRLAAAPVLADPRWMHQVITNLLTNALKFTPPGGRITIATTRSGSEAILRVPDTGAGIPADELPHVFDRFWRGRDAAHTSGSGIGLAVAAGLARAHGGQLTAASHPGQGTQMTLTLPAA